MIWTVQDFQDFLISTKILPSQMLTIFFNLFSKILDLEIKNRKNGGMGYFGDENDFYGGGLGDDFGNMGGLVI
jgi:hypothetical protein